MPRLDAPSISMTSKLLDEVISRQATHLPHGVKVGPSWQLRDLARMRAHEVLPMPRGPQNKNAWAMRLDSMDLFNNWVMWSCPMTSAKVWGRYLRAKTR